MGGVWAPNFGEAAPGFEPQTSCLRVRSVTITLRGYVVNSSIQITTRYGTLPFTCHIQRNTSLDGNESFLSFLPAAKLSSPRTV